MHCNHIIRICYFFSNSWWQLGSVVGSKLSNFMWIPGLWFQKDLLQAVSCKREWKPWRQHSILVCSLRNHILTQSSTLIARFFKISTGSCGALFKRGAEMAQWWERSPPTNVSRVRFPEPASYVGWVCCWFSTLLREVFLRVLRFSALLKNQHF